MPDELKKDMKALNEDQLEDVSGGKKKACAHNWKRISKFGEEPARFKCTLCGKTMSAS